MPILIERNGSEADVPTIVLGQLERLDGAIEKEFTLIGDRMTWMVVSESFKGSLCIRLVSADWKTHAQGNVPSRYLAPVIIMSWFVFFVIVVVELFADQTIAGVVMMVSLLTFIAIVVVIARRSFVTTIADLESRLRHLESRQASGAGGE